MELENNGMSLPQEQPQEVPQEWGVEESCRQLTGYLESILKDPAQARLDTARLCQPCRGLGEALGSFHTLAEELADYSVRLSKGDLSQAVPESGSGLYSGLKNLHANLKHLTWQAGQVTKGDYSQHVSHLGEFSNVFNDMIQQLREREAQLKQEVMRAQRRAEIIDSYTEMLVEMLDQRNEWMLVVDQTTREIIHCNKHSRDGGEGGAFCDTCDHRLPIQPKLLEWEGTERYQVWEIEGEKSGCYRVISFPIEWKGRSCCIHIVMDVTSEKMRARHLNDEIYQDGDTGVRNRQFLDEFMGQVLRERRAATLCYLDLEGVGDINTFYGRKVGDAYIQNFVEIVRKNFRSGDTFARVKDDKFCLILTGNVKHLIERKLREILTAFQRDDERVFSHRCNFRYSIVEVEGEINVRTLEKLLEEAESAINRQKRKKQKKQKKSSMMDFEDW